MHYLIKALKMYLNDMIFLIFKSLSILFVKQGRISFWNIIIFNFLMCLNSKYCICIQLYHKVVVLKYFVIILNLYHGALSTFQKNYLNQSLGILQGLACIDVLGTVKLTSDIYVKQILGAYYWSLSFAIDISCKSKYGVLFKLCLPSFQLLNKIFNIKHTFSIVIRILLVLIIVIQYQFALKQWNQIVLNKFLFLVKLNNFNFIFCKLKSSLFTTIFFSYIIKHISFNQKIIARCQESIMKQNLQLDQQSELSQMKAYEFILRVLREEHEEEHDDESSNKAIVILIFLSTGLLIFGFLVCLCKCLYDRIQKKREAQVRQLNESQYQQQIVQIETLCLYNRDLEDCPICLMPIPSILLVTTACNHKFHQACLALWLQIYNICPTCRTRVSQ
ncbi:unnamed protein product (macronuclear) [Paramecium tetraurelia]|uniref:RING-type domain-containing protein n=1 Tax=Paramecium tetraurelia TaxID=5888 RepID=A0D9I0_PARTE|nr:uncharacterized protein GSPATT00014627001 [Paramecium tetraurelia]CAK79697.1 unnamed protein product [Paramecium tetraurelia]|eukprot:XP_001447094.1 hypothetical protein (macronuclear) [Paramecium tetraurelia strain d4-2]